MAAGAQLAIVVEPLVVRVVAVPVVLVLVVVAVMAVGMLVVAAVALFIAFYPYASGLEVSREWLARMNWFKNWMWY